MPPGARRCGSTRSPPREPKRLASCCAPGTSSSNRLVTKDGARDIDIPNGLVHHWVGTVFVPGARLQDAVALLQDYDRHAEVYAPAVQRSKRLSQDGDRFTVFLRFYQKKVIAVVVNSEHEASFVRRAPARFGAASGAPGSPRSRDPERRPSARNRSAATAATCGG